MSDALDWLGAEVRVHAAFDSAKVFPAMDEGLVIGYAASPTILVRNEFGGQSHWQISLPIEIVAEPVGEAGADRELPYRAAPDELTELAVMLAAMSTLTVPTQRRVAEILGWDGKGEIPGHTWLVQRLNAYLRAR